MNKYNSTFSDNIKYQAGAASLVISIVILSLITFVTIYTSKSIITEQKIANNDVRARQAFEAAEAGITAAMTYITEDPDRDGTVGIDPIFDTDNDDIGDLSTATVSGNSKVSVTTADLSATPGAMTTIQITSVGTSSDDTASKTIVAVTSRINPLPNLPDNPLTTRGTVVITGSATIYNPEGHSTIWSGGDVDLGSNNSTSTEVADVSDANYPGCMDTSQTCPTVASSNKLTVGLDVIEYDTNLSNLSDNEFFQNFFGMSPSSFKNSMVTMETTAANAGTDIELATGEVIWVEGNTTISGSTVGCTAVTGNSCSGTVDPSILIINGNATFSGNPLMYGIVFVIGTTTIGGNTEIIGSLVSAGQLNNNAGGSLDITYNSDVLEQTAENGPMASSSGSWRDFQ